MAHLRHTDEFSEAPSVAQIERQVRWEAAAVEKGIQDYRARLAATGTAKNPVLADHSLGQTLVRSVIDRLVPVIQVSAEAVKAEQGKVSNWRLCLGLLDAETIAYLTLRAAIATGFGSVCHARSITVCADSLGKSLELEVEFRSWQQTERPLDKERRAEAAKLKAPYQSLLNRICQAVKGSNAARTWKRWRTRLDNLSRQKWGKEARIELGANLLFLLVSTCPDFFVLELVSIERGKTQTHIRLSDKALMILQDAKARAEVGTPALRPMLCRPKPWQWQETEAA